jgi:hypothetical protein
MATPHPHSDTVRQEVVRLLAAAPAYQALDEGTRAEILENMVRVGSYLTNPAPAAETPTASALASGRPKTPDAAELTGQRLAQRPGQVGAEFQAGAMRQGVEEFGNLVKKVDFPAFVSGLVKGVFQAVVDASIQQMQAYGELLAATSKSVEQFSNDHISDAQARDHLASRYPSKFVVDTGGDGPAKLKAREGGDVDLGGAYGTDGGIDLSDADAEQDLVNKAKLDMARQRQQTMATMVMLGINRIVVTDGKINAKVVFDIQADDKATRHGTAQMKDDKKDKTSESESGGLLGAIFGGPSFDHQSSHVTNVTSAIDDTSDSKAQMKAQLSGDVHLAFKSETFPLEKMVDVMGMQTINERAAPLPIGPRATPPTPLPAPVAVAPAK